MSSIINTPQSRSTKRMATGLAMVTFATMSTVVADSDESVFAWDLVRAAAEPASAPASMDEPDHAILRDILRDPQYDAESFWERDQRLMEQLECNDAPAPTASLQEAGSGPSYNVMLRSITLSEFSYAFLPLLLGGGLLWFQRKADSSRMYSRHSRKLLARFTA